MGFCVAFLDDPQRIRKFSANDGFPGRNPFSLYFPFPTSKSPLEPPYHTQRYASRLINRVLHETFLVLKCPSGEPDTE